MGLLEIWWDRKVEGQKRDLLPQYPMPWDGASFAVMSNFFSVVGFGDDRVTYQGKLNALTWLAKPLIMERFMELWPKSTPEWMKEPEKQKTMEQNIEELKAFFIPEPDDEPTP